jgi:Trypsin
MWCFDIYSCQTLTTDLFKNNFFQVIGGAVNIKDWEKRHSVQARRISNVFTPNNTDADIAILKVHSPFVYTQTVQQVTLAQPHFIARSKKN